MIEQVHSMDWGTIAAIIGPLITVMIWIQSRNDRKFDKIDQRFDKVDSEFKEIRGEIRELRTSLNRMEGAFYSKDCCMLKDDRQDNPRAS